MIKVKLMISDWDGVFTSTKFHNFDGNVQLKTYKDIDMTAVKCFWSVGVPFVVLSGDPWNRNICSQRQIPFFDSRDKDGILRKDQVIRKIISLYKISPDSVAYIGDDVFDIPAMKEVGMVFCPGDASFSVVDYMDKHDGYSNVLKRSGGHGCLDELFWFFNGHKCFEKQFDYETLLDMDKKQMVNNV